MEGSSRSARERLAWSVVGWTLAYVVAHVAGDALSDPVRHVAPVWPASGVTLAAMLSSPRRDRPLFLAVLATAGLLTNVASHDGVLMSLGFCFANALDAGLAIWLFGRVVGEREVTFTRVDEVLTLASVGVGVNAVTSLLGAASSAIFGGAPFWAAYRTWWGGALVGVVLVTPLVVTWRRATPAEDESAPPPRRLETAVFFVAWCAACWIATRASGGGPLAPRPYMLVCLLPWAALRLGLRTVTAAMVVLCIACVYRSTHWLAGGHHGAVGFEGGDYADSLLRAQLYVVLAAVTGLFLAATTTEARVARAAADRSATHLSLALDAARMGTWEWTVGSDRIHWSDQVIRFFGVTRDTFPSTYDAYVAMLHPDDRASVVATIQRALEQSSTGYTIEHRIIRPDGTVRWLECRGRLDRDAAGAPVRMAGTVVDITEQQQVVERLRQTQKMEAFGQLAGGVAHDFNNLLAVILMQAELARKNEALGPQAGPVLDEIQTAAERGAALTKQLLAFARRQVLQPKPVDLDRAVADVTTMLARLLGEDVKMRFVPSGDRLVARVDVSMLDQVIVNLAVNARDAMPDGGELTITTGRTILAADLEEGVPAGEYVTIRVADSGTGIEEEHMARLFEPFFTTKPPGRGTGLGLATVFGILRLHHGYVRVTSDVGQGSTFEVLLPPCAEEPEPIATRTSAPSSPRPRETILLVEDDPSVRKTTRMLLEMHDFAVLEAKSGGEALQLWDEHGERVALLFTDMTMPGGLDGRQLADELRRRRPDLKVVLTSGYSEQMGGELAAGERFLLKPSTLPELLDAVNGALGG